MFPQAIRAVQSENFSREESVVFVNGVPLLYHFAKKAKKEGTRGRRISGIIVVTVLWTLYLAPGPGEPKGGHTSVI